MADAAPVVHIGENSPEQVALVLMRSISTIQTEKAAEKDKKYFLDLYAECLRAVKGQRSPKLPVVNKED